MINYAEYTLFLPHLDIPNPPLVNLSEIVLRHFDTNLPIHFLKKVLYLKKIGHTSILLHSLFIASASY